MTTLILTEDQWFSDTQRTHNGVVDREVDKIFKVPSGVTAVCGDFSLCRLAKDIDNYTKEQLQEEGKGYTGVIYHYQKDLEELLFYVFDGETVRVEFEIFPVVDGSGYTFAVAALDMGKTPEEAISYASTRDIYTNNKIISVVI